MDALKQIRATSTVLRALCGTLLALSLMAHTACSYFTDFVIVNDSGSPVEVSYSFRNWRESGECCPERPAQKPLDKLDDNDVAWRELRAEEFQFDRATGTLTLTLAPSEVLRVTTQSNWRGHGDLSDDKSFAIDSVRISGANGGVLYEGMQAQYQFQRQDANLYKLTYYGWGDKR
jgi:hypothetical protein